MLLSVKSGNSGKVHISIDGEYCMTVDGGFWRSLALPDRCEIDEAQLEEISALVNGRRAYNRGIDLLSRRDHSRAELVRKLNEKGFADSSEAAAELLCENGYLNDARFAENYARELLERKGMGKKRIAAELHKKGVSREDVYAALDKLEVDAEEQIIHLLETKFSRLPTDEKGLKKRFNALVRLGYSPSDVSRAMRSFDFDTETDLIY